MYRRSARQRLALLGLLAVTAVVVTLDFRSNPGGPIRRVQDAAVSLVAPVQEGISTVLRPIGDFLSTLRDIPTLKRRVSELENERDRLRERQSAIPEIQRENERLRALLSEQSWKAGKTLGAAVISGPISNLEASRLLDKGSDDGVREGMSVVAAEGLLGRVVFTAPKYSKVLLLIDPRHAVGARLTATGETGVVEGRNEQDLFFDLIDISTKVDPGETVVTSGYDRGIYPPGIPIGRVTKIATSKSGVSKTALVRPFVDFGRLDHVLVLLESGPVTDDGA